MLKYYLTVLILFNVLEEFMNLKKGLVTTLAFASLTTYLFVTSTAAPGAEWKKNDKGWWYEEADGSYPTNAWKLIKDKWYYFDNVGYMVENRWVGNYYLGADGAMLVSTSTPDGYYVDATGKWIEGAKRAVNITKTSGSGSKRSSSGGSSRSSGGSNSGGGSLATYGDVAGTDNTSGNHEIVTPTREADNSGTGNTAGSGNNTIVTPNTSGTNSNNNITNFAGSESNNAAPIGNEATNQESRVISELQSMGLSEKEAKLYYLINAYRESLGLPKLSFSKSLTIVARAHVSDSNAYEPENQVDSRGMQGNLHSWSANGGWTPVVYTSDHRYANNMWSKPRELTAYTGNGYEISSASGGNISPEAALNLWKGSSGHNAVMTGQSGWSMLKTMGVAIDGRYAHVWFGSDADPAGYYDVANYDVIYP